MGDAFFGEVTGRIPFGGLDSTDPLAFKVYQPDRLVHYIGIDTGHGHLGERHGRSGGPDG